LGVANFGGQFRLAIEGTTGDHTHRSQPWFEAYLAVLFESDGEQLVEKIKLARKLVMTREREELGQQETAVERTDLNKASYALQALQLRQL